MNEVSRGDGKNRLDARTYRAMRLAHLKKIEGNMSQVSGNDLHPEVSRKSDGRCESCDPSCKRQRVGLATQRQKYVVPQDVYTQKLARSPHMDGSPVSMEEGEVNGANDDVYSQEPARSPPMDGSPACMEEGEISGANDDVYSQESARSPQRDGSPGDIVGANEDVYTQELSRSPLLDGSPGGIVGANEDIYTQDLARSPQMEGSPISMEEGEIVSANENGSPMALTTSWDNPRFKKYLLPVQLSVIQDDQSLQVSRLSPTAPPAGLDNPRFTEYWVPVQLSSIQLEQYCSTLINVSALLCSTAKRGNLNTLHNVLCNLRKCCDHPYVLDKTLSTFSKERSPLDDLLSIGTQASGKLQLLSKFLPHVRDQGLRVLIVYKTSSNSGKNCVGVGDILDDFLSQTFGQESLVHIYNSDSVTKKNTQAAIDLFNDKASGRFIALTGYKSSLASIRPTSLDVVVLFNSDWNPANDIRALQKMTLHTEKDHLRVFRLYSVSTLEEEALALARDGAPVKAVNQSTSRIACNKLLAWGAAYLFEKLDALHASKETNYLENGFLCSVMHELSAISSSNIDDPSISCSVISKVSEVGRGYPGNMKLCGEHLEAQSLDDVPSNVFWSSLLDDRSPHWRFLPEEAESAERRIPLCEPRWSRGRSNAKRSKRSRRCAWGKTALTKEASSSLADCMAQGTETNLSVETMGLSSVNSDISEHIQKIDETHKRQMQELTQKQQRETLEFFRTKKEARETMKKVYELQKVLICELYSESLDKLKELDERFQKKSEGLRHEMKKCWENLQAAHETARSNEEEMRSKMINLLKSTASTLLEDSDGAMVASSSISVDSGDRSLDIVEVSPHCSPMEDVVTIPVVPDNQIQEVSAPGILAEPVISGSSSVEQLDALVAEITSDDPITLPVCSTLLHSELGSGSQDEAAVPDSSSRKHLGVVYFPVTPDNVRASDRSQLPGSESGADVLKENQNQATENAISCSYPITESQGHLDGMRSSDEVAVPSDKTGCFPDTPNICVISDDEQMHEISASTPVAVGELQDTGNLLEEVPGTTTTTTTPSEQLNPCSMGNQHEEVQRMSNGVLTGGSSQPLESSARASNAFSMQTDNHLMLSQAARWTEENTQPHLSYMGRNYYVRTSSRSFDARSNIPLPANFDPLQNELEQIKKAADEALKKHEDMLLQFAAARDQEMAQIYQKYSLLSQDANSALMQKQEELKLIHQKTKAHKLLADAWRLFIQENSPLDIMILQPPPLQSTVVPLANGMQTSTSPLSRQFFANQFSDMAPTDQTVRPPSYHPFYNPQGGWRPYVPNQHLRSAVPLAGFHLSQMNQHPLNFCSPGSSAGGSYSQQPYNFGDYLAPPP